MSKTLEEILNKYQVTHKSDANCKCIEGAVGRLRIEVRQLIETEKKNAVEEYKRSGEISPEEERRIYREVLKPRKITTDASTIEKLNLFRGE